MNAGNGAQLGPVIGGQIGAYMGGPEGAKLASNMLNLSAEPKRLSLPLAVERVADQPLLCIKVGPLFTYATLDEAVVLRAQLDTQIAALSEGML